MLRDVVAGSGLTAIKRIHPADIQARQHDRSELRDGDEPVSPDGHANHGLLAGQAVHAAQGLKVLRLASGVRLGRPRMDRKDGRDSVCVAHHECGVPEPSPAVQDEPCPGRAARREPAGTWEQGRLQLSEGIRRVFDSRQQQAAYRLHFAHGLHDEVESRLRVALPPHLPFCHQSAASK